LIRRRCTGCHYRLNLGFHGGPVGQKLVFGNGGANRESVDAGAGELVDHGRGGDVAGDDEAPARLLVGFFQGLTSGVYQCFGARRDGPMGQQGDTGTADGHGPAAISGYVVGAGVQAGRMAFGATGIGIVFYARAAQPGQRGGHINAAEQAVDAHFHGHGSRAPGGARAGVDHFQAAFCAQRPSAAMVLFQPGTADADILEADMPYAQRYGGLDEFEPVVHRAVVAGKHENEVHRKGRARARVTLHHSATGLPLLTERHLPGQKYDRSRILDVSNAQATTGPPGVRLGRGLAMSVPNELLCYCRPGFEPDLAAELHDKAGRQGFEGEARAQPHSGCVRYVLPPGEAANTLHRSLPLAALVFARQSLVALPPLSLDRNDRLSPIVAQVTASGWNFETLWQETPDTNAAKALSPLIKALKRPLESSLKKRGALRRKAGARRLHLWWSDGDRVQLGMSFPGNRSDEPGGIRRLRFPRAAPSRSALKLEEAWHEFIPRDQWPTRLAEGMQAADLGAAPGGWTWQLVNRGMQVHAIDNGPMNPELMASGMVTHLRKDGFTWIPPRRLDWLVCDIVDKPSRVIDMMTRWLARRWCREAIFNLKLPMKRRWLAVRDGLVRLQATLGQAGVRADIACRHLYHDREEVTVHVRLLD